MKVIISKLHNEEYVFEYENGSCRRIYKISDSRYKVGAILIGRIRDIKNDLNCCFVEMGDGNIGYLSFDDCNPAFLLNRSYDGRYKQGDEILVKITRLPSKNKPYSLSMYIEIAGQYSVISSKGNGYCVSQKIGRKDKERLLYDVTKAFDDEDFSNISCLLRTDSLDADFQSIIEEIKANRNLLLDIINKASKRTVFSFVYEPCKDYIKRILDNGIENIEEIVTDISYIYDELVSLAKFQKVLFYKDTTMSINVLYNLDRAYTQALSRKVYLDCGGYLVIDPTEALTVIDVNSGKYISKKNNKDTINLVNKEAAEMISLQLKLRNISGIVIVDFINCSKDEEALLVSYMKSLTKNDKVKTVIEGFTSLGLLELTRQKIYPSIYEK